MMAAARVAGVELVRLRLPDGVGAGLLHVEVQHGAPRPGQLLSLLCPP